MATNVQPIRAKTPVFSPKRGQTRHVRSVSDPKTAIEYRDIFLTMHFAYLENNPMSDTYRPVPNEIEITPEMIEAGVRRFRLSVGVWDRLIDQDEQIVSDIFERMMALAPPRLSSLVL